MANKRVIPDNPVIRAVVCGGYHCGTPNTIITNSLLLRLVVSVLCCYRASCTLVMKFRLDANP